MSRIGKKPAKIPDGVKVPSTAATCIVEGPKGKLQQALRPEVTVGDRRRQRHRRPHEPTTAKAAPCTASIAR